MTGRCPIFKASKIDLSIQCPAWLKNNFDTVRRWKVDLVEHHGKTRVRVTGYGKDGKSKRQKVPREPGMEFAIVTYAELFNRIYGCRNSNYFRGACKYLGLGSNPKTGELYVRQGFSKFKAHRRKLEVQKRIPEGTPEYSALFFQKANELYLRRVKKEGPSKC